MNTKSKLLRQLTFPLSLLAMQAPSGQSLTPPSAAADSAAITPLRLEKKSESSPNRFQLGYRMAFNISASFQNVGTFPARSNPNPHDNPAHPGFSIRNYDDGYVGEDTTHDMHGSYQGTWYWGYDHSSQVQGDTLVMHSSSSTGASSGDRGESLQHGIELTYTRELSRHEKWRLGLEGAFNFTPVCIKDSSRLASVYNRVSDVYQLNGVIPPSTLPYNGSFGGAGAVIGDSPTRSQSIAPEPITGSRSLEADLFGFRVGPYLELPLGKNVSLDLNAGLAVVIARSDFGYNQLVSTPDSGTFRQIGSSSASGVMVGGYAGARISVQFAKDWSAFGGAQFQDVGTYQHRSLASGQSAKLDLSQSVFVSFGVSRSF